MLSGGIPMGCQTSSRSKNQGNVRSKHFCARSASPRGFNRLHCG
jgi:hypothetical protein